MANHSLSDDETEVYSHSTVHYAIACHDHAALGRLLQNLPTLPPAHDVSTEEESRIAEDIADRVADVIDRRDVPGGESPLHLAVRLRDATAVEMLMAAGANWSLYNDQGWSALQEAVCAREEEIAMIISKYYFHMGWVKWSRRMPLVAAAIRKIRNFYMEVSFNFESSVIPFISRIAPSDTYRIWKMGSNVRADMTLVGYDGFRAQRSPQSVLLLGNGSEDGKIPSGSVLILFHKDKEVTNATEGGSTPPSEAAEIAHKAAIMSPTNVYRVGIDVTQSELVPQMNWRRQERIEKIGPWKSIIFDMHQLTVSVKSRRVPVGVADAGTAASDLKRCNHKDDSLNEEEQQQLEDAFNMEDVDSDDEGFVNGNERQDPQPDGFNHARGTCDNGVHEPGSPSTSGRGGVNVAEPVRPVSDRRKAFFLFGKKPEKQEPWKMHPWSAQSRGTLANRDFPSKAAKNNEAGGCNGVSGGSVSARKESERAVKRDGYSSESASRLYSSNSGNFEREYKKRLRPVIWLTPDFPVKTEELLPLLDVLANRVKAVWRLRELLTTKLPAGTFPVKVAVPVFPTIRMVVTFSKCQELLPTYDSCAPPASAHSHGSKMHPGKPDFSGMTEPGASTGKAPLHHGCAEEQLDPFMVPNDYTWVDMKEKRRRMREKNGRGCYCRSPSSKSPEGSSQNGNS